MAWVSPHFSFHQRTVEELWNSILCPFAIFQRKTSGINARLKECWKDLARLLEPPGSFHKQGLEADGSDGSPVEVFEGSSHSIMDL